MKSVSLWARRNMRKARLLIILSETLLFILAVRLGLLLLHAGIFVPGVAITVPLFILSAALLLARHVKVLSRRSNGFYFRQRLCFFLMGLSIFLLTVFFVGSEKLLAWNTYSSLSGSGVSMMLKPAPSSAQKFSASQLKKMNRLLKKMRKHDDLKWLYIFLTILGGLLLLYVVAALSCSLSCSGNDGLAIAVLLVGGAGVIFLCFWLIRKIIKGKTPKKMKPDDKVAAPSAVHSPVAESVEV